MLGTRGTSRFNKAHLSSSIRSIQNMRISVPVLYGDESSPPVRAVMITASLLGMNYHFHKIDLFRGENRSEFYKKINPLQKVPSMLIDGEVICDSHAIVMYLCRKAGDRDLYSEDYIRRAKVDEIILFNATTLFPIDSALFADYVSGNWPPDEFKVNQWYSALDHLETQLYKHEWLSGDKMQLSDICCSMTVTSLAVIIPLPARHKKISEWLKKLNSLPCFEINRRGLEQLRNGLEQCAPHFNKMN